MEEKYEQEMCVQCSGRKVICFVSEVEPCTRSRSKSNWFSIKPVLVL